MPRHQSSRVVASAFLTAAGLAALGSATTPTWAQDGNGTIRYRHSAGSGAPAALEYTPPGRPSRPISSGQTLTLAAPASVCFDVADANPLLYDYVLKADTVATPSLAGLSDFAAALRTALDPNATPMEVTNLDLRRFSEPTISSALESIRIVEALRLRSDSIGFLPAADSARGPFDHLRRFAADTTPVNDAKERAARAWVLATARTLEAEWASATKAVDAAGTLRKCQRFDDAVLSVQFSVSKRGSFPKDVAANRYVGEVVKELEVRPLDSRLVVFSLGAVFGIFDNVPEHAVRDGIVATDTATRRPLRPMALMLARPARTPLWLALGVGTGTEKIERPDLFLGLAIRAGGTPSKPLLTLGLGAIHSSFPTALPVGAAAGQPLPESIPKLSEALGMRGRWGIGITLGLQGIDFFSKSKE